MIGYGFVLLSSPSNQQNSMNGDKQLTTASLEHRMNACRDASRRALKFHILAEVMSDSL